MWKLVPHHQGDPVVVPQGTREVTIGSGVGPAAAQGSLHVRITHDKYISRIHFLLRFCDDGSVLVTNRSSANTAFLNGLELPFGEATLAERDADNARYQPPACPDAPLDAPIIFANVPNTVKALVQPWMVDGCFTGYSLVRMTAAAHTSAPAAVNPSPSSPSQHQPQAQPPSSTAAGTDGTSASPHKRHAEVGIFEEGRRRAAKAARGASSFAAASDSTASSTSTSAAASATATAAAAASASAAMTLTSAPAASGASLLPTVKQQPSGGRIFEGMSFLIPKVGANAGRVRHQLQLTVVLRHGGAVVGSQREGDDMWAFSEAEVASATHVILDGNYQLKDAGLEGAQHAAVHLPEWISWCSAKKLLDEAKHVHPSMVRDGHYAQQQQQQQQQRDGTAPTTPHRDSMPTNVGGAASDNRGDGLQASPSCRTPGGPSFHRGRVVGASGGGGVTTAARDEDGDGAYEQPPPVRLDQEGDRDAEAFGPVAAKALGLTTKELIMQKIKALASIYKCGGGGATYGRAQHYGQFVGTVEGALTEPVTLAKINALRRMHGVGKESVDKLVEIYKTGELKRLVELEKDPKNVARLQLTKVWGIGESTAAELIGKGVMSREQLMGRPELLKTLRDGAVRSLELHDELSRKISRAEIERLGELVREAAMTRMRPPPLRVHIAGSYRREKDGSTDVDVLIIVRDEAEAADDSGVARLRDDGSGRIGRLTDGGERGATCGDDGSLGSYDDHRGGGRSDASDDTSPSESYKLRHLLALIELLHADGVLTDHLTMPKRDEKSGAFAGNFYMGIFRLGQSGCHHRIDIRCFEEHEEAPALLHCTGSGIFNRVMQRVALAKGLQLSEKGLCKAIHKSHGEVQKCGTYIEGLRTEEAIFDALGLLYREPRDREHRHDVIETATGRPFFEKAQTRRAAEAGDADDIGVMPLALEPPRDCSHLEIGGEALHALGLEETVD
jgi:DNA polymerase/3'-5' exonuclease PolX